MSLGKAVLSLVFTGAFPCKQLLSGPRNPEQPLYAAAEVEYSLQPGKGNICHSHRNYFGGGGGGLDLAASSPVAKGCEALIGLPLIP